MRDPNIKLTRKFGGQSLTRHEETYSPDPKTPPLPVELLGALNDEGAPDLKALETMGLLPSFLRHWNNPAALKHIKLVAEHMRGEGVDRKNSAAVKVWAGKHAGALEFGSLHHDAPADHKTVVRPGPSVGRNDPCPCGSKKKFKKCCAA